MNKSIPEHIAIIMDGNGRWATARNLPRSAGHKAGAERISDLLAAAEKFNIPYITVYAFSTENWKRPKTEVDALMKLLDHFLNTYTDKLMSGNIRLFVIGRREQLSQDLQKKIADVEKKTEKNSGLTFTIALNYGGRSEIADAAAKIAGYVQCGKIKPSDVDEKTFCSIPVSSRTSGCGFTHTYQRRIADQQFSSLADILCRNLYNLNSLAGF